MLILAARIGNYDIREQATHDKNLIFLPHKDILSQI